MYPRVLVANRGEIACRVIRTLRALGVASVAVYHHVDRDAPHVAQADARVELRGDVPSGAYLDGAQILDAAQATGAQAIHPGYGFLSENAAFADACAARGVRFIGPSAEVMRAMGDKLRSRELAARAGARVSEAVALDGTPEAIERAVALGFPLLIKASAGGGGKGMKVVQGRGELDAAAALARGEAQRYFGDGRVYAERLLLRPRHIEVQVMGDGRGNVVHLGERECSIQRRYQKLIEESPAAALLPALRTAIIENALAIARAARYENAGTVEFIVGDDGTYQFLEMNTRLQVEHPVTEMVTGLDLVAEQLHIAQTNTLSFAQTDVRFSGHAIECRICAEEPERGFRPATGRVGLLRLPVGEGVRVECGVREGQRVTSAFDSMLMKVVTHGANRAEAIERMKTALNELVVLGVATNIDALGRVLATEAFARGALHTGFLDEHAEVLSAPPHDDVAALVAALGEPEMRRAIDDVPEPYASMGAFRN